jgi:hypothetical protein
MNLSCPSKRSFMEVTYIDSRSGGVRTGNRRLFADRLEFVGPPINVAHAATSPDIQIRDRQQLEDLGMELISNAVTGRASRLRLHEMDGLRPVSLADPPQNSSGLILTPFGDQLTHRLVRCRDDLPFGFVDSVDDLRQAIQLELATVILSISSRKRQGRNPCLTAL